MHPSTFISSLYGEIRGYHRLAIRRLANQHQGLSRDALAQMTSDLLGVRIDSALSRFPFYKDVVVKHRGHGDGSVPLQELPVWTRNLQREFFDQQTRARPEVEHSKVVPRAQVLLDRGLEGRNAWLA